MRQEEFVNNSINNPNKRDKKGYNKNCNGSLETVGLQFYIYIFIYK